MALGFTFVGLRVSLLDATDKVIIPLPTSNFLSFSFPFKSIAYDGRRGSAYAFTNNLHVFFLLYVFQLVKNTPNLLFMRLELSFIVN